MAEATKTLAPPYATYKSFSNLINDLREGGMPSHVTRSVIKGSNSDKATMNASLRALGLILDDATPTSEFRQLIDDRENYSAKLKVVVERTYSFLFDGSVDISNTTTEKVAEKFKEAGASGSTISKCMSFFLALAKDAGIQVSNRVKAPAPTRNANGSRKKAKKVELNGGNDRGGDDSDDNDDGQGGTDGALEGMERITVSLRGMPDGIIYFPEGLDGDSAVKAVRLAIFALKNYYDLGDEDVAGTPK